MPGSPPLPPERPLAGDCCDGGCDPCVHDLYGEAMRAYEAAVAAWRERERERQRDDADPGPDGHAAGGG